MQQWEYLTLRLGASKMSDKELDSIHGWELVSAYRTGIIFGGVTYIFKRLKQLD